MKRTYRKQLLRLLLSVEKNEDIVVELNMKDSIYILDDPWDTPSRVWRKFGLMKNAGD